MIDVRYVLALHLPYIVLCCLVWCSEKPWDGLPDKHRLNTERLSNWLKIIQSISGEVGLALCTFDIYPMPAPLPLPRLSSLSRDFQTCCNLAFCSHSPSFDPSESHDSRMLCNWDSSYLDTTFCYKRTHDCLRSNLSLLVILLFTLLCKGWGVQCPLRQRPPAKDTELVTFLLLW